MTDPRFDPAFQRGYNGPDLELVVRDHVPAVSVLGRPDTGRPLRRQQLRRQQLRRRARAR